MSSSNFLQETTNVGIIGGGAWGTALAIHCAKKGHSTKIWALEPEVVASINGPEKVNAKFLPAVKVPESLTASSSLADVVQGAELILMVVPTPFVAKTLAPITRLLQPAQILVSCTKGILNDSLETVNEVLQRVLPASFHSRLAYLSGPSFAVEVAQGIPTAVTIAAEDDAVAARAQLLISTPRLRCYRTADVAGVELGGALKNVLAIACGISDGLGFGNNGRAALITRGLNEIVRIAVAKGAHPLTMGGLAGMGDLVLTCTGDLSRNRTVGLRLGKGEKLPDITASMGGAVAEGVLTSRAAHQLAQKLDLDCPIIEGIFKVIHEGADPLRVVEEVMSRALRAEVDDSVLARATDPSGPLPSSAS